MLDIPIVIMLSLPVVRDVAGKIKYERIEYLNKESKKG
jgi:hypothetical protein